MFHESTPFLPISYCFKPFSQPLNKRKREGKTDGKRRKYRGKEREKMRGRKTQNQNSTGFCTGSCGMCHACHVPCCVMLEKQFFKELIFQSDTSQSRCHNLGKFQKLLEGYYNHLDPPLLKVRGMYTPKDFLKIAFCCVIFASSNFYHHLFKQLV